MKKNGKTTSTSAVSAASAAVSTAAATTAIASDSNDFDFNLYAKKMRKELSNQEIYCEDGAINHAYFLTKKGQYWTPHNQKALQRGLELFGKISFTGYLPPLSLRCSCFPLGVGEWKDINYYEFNEKAVKESTHTTS